MRNIDSFGSIAGGGTSSLKVLQLRWKKNFPYSQQLSFNDFHVDLHEFHQGYEYGLAYDYGSWNKNFSKNQSLYDRDNEERLINSNTLNNKTTLVNTT